SKSCSELRTEIRPDVLPFYPIHIGPIDYPVSTWCWVITREVPISFMLRTGSMQVIQCLINYLYFCLDVGSTDNTGNLLGNLLIRERRINSLHIILHVRLGEFQRCYTLLVNLFNDISH